MFVLELLATVSHMLVALCTVYATYTHFHCTEDVGEMELDVRGGRTLSECDVV
jgi:hypothetical protein